MFINSAHINNSGAIPVALPRVALILPPTTTGPSRVFISRVITHRSHRRRMAHGATVRRGQVWIENRHGWWWCGGDQRRIGCSRWICVISTCRRWLCSYWRRMIGACQRRRLIQRIERRCCVATAQNRRRYARIHKRYRAAGGRSWSHRQRRRWNSTRGRRAIGRWPGDVACRGRCLVPNLSLLQTAVAQLVQQRSPLLLLVSSFSSSPGRQKER